MQKIIRDEYATFQKESGKDHHLEQQQEADLQESLQKILMADEVVCDYSKVYPNLIQAVMEQIGEFIAELESRYSQCFIILNSWSKSALIIPNFPFESLQ